jgi:Ras-related protein Rab-11A
LLRATRDEFREDTRTTIGLDFFNMTIGMGSVITKATIWDTGTYLLLSDGRSGTYDLSPPAGQDRYRAVSRAYYRGAWGVMLVYDITNRESFKNVANWLAEVREHAPSEARVTLVGSKSDLVHIRAVTTDEAKAFAEKNGLAFMETSAKDATNVREAFHSLLTGAFKWYPVFGMTLTDFC